jgi:hypothetical protein
MNLFKIKTLKEEYLYPSVIIDKGITMPEIIKKTCTPLAPKLKTLKIDSSLIYPLVVQT